MPAITASINNDQAARVISIKYEGASGAAILAAAHSLESSTPPVTTVTKAVESIVAKLAGQADNYTVQGLQSLAASSLPGALGEPFNALHANVAGRRADLDKRRAGLMGMDRLTPEAAAEARTALRGLKQNAAIQLVLSDADIGAAALANWSLTGLPASVRPTVEDTTIAANMRRIYASQTPTRPTADNLFPGEANSAEVDRLVKEATRAFEAQRAELNALEAMLHDTLNFAAALSGQTRDAVFNALRG